MSSVPLADESRPWRAAPRWPARRRPRRPSLSNSSWARAELLAGVDAPVVPPQPLPVHEVRAGQLDDETGTGRAGRRTRGTVVGVGAARSGGRRGARMPTAQSVGLASVIRSRSRAGIVASSVRPRRTADLDELGERRRRARRGCRGRRWRAGRRPPRRGRSARGRWARGTHRRVAADAGGHRPRLTPSRPPGPHSSIIRVARAPRAPRQAAREATEEGARRQRSGSPRLITSPSSSISDPAPGGARPRWSWVAMQRARPGEASGGPAAQRPGAKAAAADRSYQISPSRATGRFDADLHRGQPRGALARARIPSLAAVLQRPRQRCHRGGVAVEVRAGEALEEQVDVGPRGVVVSTSPRRPHGPSATYAGAAIGSRGARGSSTALNTSGYTFARLRPDRGARGARAARNSEQAASGRRPVAGEEHAGPDELEPGPPGARRAARSRPPRPAPRRPVERPRTPHAARAAASARAPPDEDRRSAPAPARRTPPPRPTPPRASAPVGRSLQFVGDTRRQNPAVAQGPVPGPPVRVRHRSVTRARAAWIARRSSAGAAPVPPQSAPAGGGSGTAAPTSRGRQSVGPRRRRRAPEAETRRRPAGGVCSPSGLGRREAAAPCVSGGEHVEAAAEKLSSMRPGDRTGLSGGAATRLARSTTVIPRCSSSSANGLPRALDRDAGHAPLVERARGWPTEQRPGRRPHPTRPRSTNRGESSANESSRLGTRTTNTRPTRLGQQTAGHGVNALHGGAVEPLGIVHQADQRLLLGRPGQQAQHRQADHPGARAAAPSGRPTQTCRAVALGFRPGALDPIQPSVRTAGGDRRRPAPSPTRPPPPARPDNPTPAGDVVEQRRSCPRRARRAGRASRLRPAWTLATSSSSASHSRCRPRNAAPPSPTGMRRRLSTATAPDAGISSGRAGRAGRRRRLGDQSLADAPAGRVARAATTARMPATPPIDASRASSGSTLARSRVLP